MVPEVRVIAATAAAIVTAANLPEALQEELGTEQKFVVHPHLATISTSDSVLRSYVRSVYSEKNPSELLILAEAFLNWPVNLPSNPQPENSQRLLLSKCRRKPRTLEYSLDSFLALMMIWPTE